MSFSYPRIFSAVPSRKIFKKYEHFRLNNKMWTKEFQRIQKYLTKKIKKEKISIKKHINLTHNFTRWNFSTFPRNFFAFWLSYLRTAVVDYRICFSAAPCFFSSFFSFSDFCDMLTISVLQKLCFITFQIHHIKDNDILFYSHWSYERYLMSNNKQDFRKLQLKKLTESNSILIRKTLPKTIEEGLKQSLKRLLLNSAEWVTIIGYI